MVLVVAAVDAWCTDLRVCYALFEAAQTGAVAAALVVIDSEAWDSKALGDFASTPVSPRHVQRRSDTQPEAAAR